MSEKNKSKIKIIGSLIFSLLLTQNTFAQINGVAKDSRLIFKSSDAKLVKAFNWAKRQAMAFVFDNNDPVGLWYEAAEPGRVAFCMRDVAHQAMGAHALGLTYYNLNMLKRFAENISDARDWCSLWEIDRFNRPAPVDYKNDAEFWFNLPANFDILDCCYRMYLWSGDLNYVKDPVFLNYYDKTVNDYVDRWGLSIDQIMKRPRLINIRGVIDPDKKFQKARGIPGYDEGKWDYTLGIDLISTQYSGYLAYSYIQEVLGNNEAGEKFRKKAEEFKGLVNNVWWNDSSKCFYSYLDSNHKLMGRAGSSILDRNVVDDEKKIANSLHNSRANSIEVLYNYGNQDSAYARLLDMADPGKSRLDYPEVSYSFIGALVNGMMGINIEAESPRQSEIKGMWVEIMVATLPKLSEKTQWAELNNLPVRTNEITVRHEGNGKTILTNLKGPALIWKAEFPGTQKIIYVDGKPKDATIEKKLGKTISWIRTAVGPGNTIVVKTASKN